jgi:hypothetical protein
MIELLLPYGFDTLEYSWMKATIGICTLTDYFVAKKCQHLLGPASHGSTTGVLGTSFESVPILIRATLLEPYHCLAVSRQR